MTVTYTDFIETFPEFSDDSKFPMAQATIWLGEGTAQLNANRLGNRMPLAVMLFAGHQLVLSAMAARVTSAGGIPINEGLTASKAVGSVSKSYDNGSVMMGGAEDYNRTTYGQRLWRIISTMCAGPVYVRGSGSGVRVF